MAHHTNLVDAYAKEVNSQWPARVRELQLQLARADATRKGLLMKVHHFHTNVASITRASKAWDSDADANPSPPPTYDVQVHLHRLMVRVSFQLVGWGEPVDWSSWVMSGASTNVLLQFMLQQQWVHDDVGMSLCEFYFLFLSATGWFVPVNVGKCSEVGSSFPDPKWYYVQFGSRRLGT